MAKNESLQVVTDGPLGNCRHSFDEASLDFVIGKKGKQGEHKGLGHLG